MSVTVERKQLVEIARSMYSGNSEIETHLSKIIKKKPIAGFFIKMEEKLWRMVKEEHPWKDFTGEQESRTRGNILKKFAQYSRVSFELFYEGPSCF